MTEILHSPPQLPSSSSSITSITPTNNDGLLQQQHTLLLNNNECIINSDTVALYRRNPCANTQIQQQVEREDEDEDEDEDEELSVLAVLVTIFRKSLVGCKSISEFEVEEHMMDIGCPTNVRHVAHVTFDRFNGFLGLPVEFEPEVPRRPPSASTRVFGVSTESMQLSFDSRGNCVPTILLMMQRRLYSQGGLQSEGIFRINPENGQEEYVREQLNNGLIPDNIDVHCLAGLIKAWFRELPRGVLDSLSSEQVMQAQSEEECAHLVRHLPPTEAALLDWAINLMADVAQLEHLNKMNARNIAMVFAPNMTQMLDPLTALMYAVQVMNFLKMLIVKTLREREDSIVESGPTVQLEPSDEDGHHSILKPTLREREDSMLESGPAVQLEPSDEDGHHSILNQINPDASEAIEDEELNVSEEPQSNDTIKSNSQAEPKTGNETHGFLSSIENILPDEKGHAAADNCPSDIPNSLGTTQTRTRRTKAGQPSNSSNHVKKGSRKHAPRPVVHVNESAEKNKEISIISRVNSHTERVEAWR